MKHQLITLMLVSMLAMSVQGAYLTGYVEDTGGTGIVGVSILADTETDTTIALGFYNVTLANGVYTVRASKQGYMPNTVTATVSGNTEQNITLATWGYAVTDTDDVVVDLIGEGLVSAKGEVPSWVSMGSMVVILVLVLVALGMLLSVCIGLPLLAMTKLMSLSSKKPSF